MFESYLKQVSGYGVNELLDMRADYIDRLDALGMLQWQLDRSDQKIFQQVLKGALTNEEKPQEQSKDRGREL
jgi:hypothetical protein